MVVAPIGKGGFGSVYRCHGVLSKRLLAAVKVMEPQNMDNARDRFIREAEVLASLDHPSVVRIRNAGESGPYLYLAMDLIEGETLHARMAREAMTVDRALPIFQQIADGLAHAHERQVTHRDIKPANIVLRSDERPVVVDFGIAAIGDRSRLTADGMMPGTLPYMPPEVFGGETPNPGLSDIYAMGLLLHEALTGKFVYPEDMALTSGQRMVQIMALKTKSLSMDPGPGFEMAVRDVIRAATEPEPSQRTQTMRELVLALAGCGAEETFAGLNPYVNGLDSTAGMGFNPPTTQDFQGGRESTQLPPGGDSQAPNGETTWVSDEKVAPGDARSKVPTTNAAPTAEEGTSVWKWVVGGVLLVVLLLGIGFLVAGGAGVGVLVGLWGRTTPAGVDSDVSVETDVQTDVPDPLQTGENAGDNTASDPTRSGEGRRSRSRRDKPLGTEDASANSSGESSADGQSEPAAHQEESQGGSTEESSGSSTQVIERVVVVNRTAGDGPAAAQGQTAVVDYTMSKQDGSVLYSTDERGEPFTFVIGNGKFKPMFDDAVVGMRVGGQRVVTYPPGAGWTRILGRRLSEEDRFVLELKLRELDPGASEPAASSSASVKTLVDCSAPENQQPGAIKSLLSYSKHYHSQAVSGRERANSCRQALSYRGSAYCQNPADQTVASLLAETQKVCSGQQ